MKVLLALLAAAVLIPMVGCGSGESGTDELKDVPKAPPVDKAAPAPAKAGGGPPPPGASGLDPNG